MNGLKVVLKKFSKSVGAWVGRDDLGLQPNHRVTLRRPGKRLPQP
jgi:hypothetical protein